MSGCTSGGCRTFPSVSKYLKAFQEVPEGFKSLRRLASEIQGCFGNLRGRFKSFEGVLRRFHGIGGGGVGWMGY